MNCAKCNEQHKPLKWFTGNGPGIPWTQNLVCDNCYAIQLDEHTDAWARNIINHFMLTHTNYDSDEWKKLIRKKIIELLQEQNKSS